MLDWNDLRYFLAVARTGSTLAAGRLLRVSQTTVARRIVALEQALGLVLFERKQSGYALTEAALALLEKAHAVEAAVESFSDAVAASSRETSGTVRLTTLDIYAVTFLPPILRDLHIAYPSIRIEIDTTEKTRDLAAGAADIALRSSGSPSGAGLVGRRIASDPWTIYCSRDYAAQHQKPYTAEDLRRHPFIGGGGEGVWRRYNSWLKQQKLEDAVVIHQPSATGLLAAVRAGSGLAVLPCFVADRERDLVRCIGPISDDRTGLWLITHERLRHVPRVRAVMDFLADRLTRLARQPEDQHSAQWGCLMCG